MPENLKVVFANSGTEANELAMMIAQLYTGCHEIISLRNVYAAGTMRASAQCSYKFNVAHNGVDHALNPDQHRCLLFGWIEICKRCSRPH